MNSHGSNNNFQGSIKVLQYITVIGFIILIGRIFHLQILDHETYEPLSMQNHLRMEVVNPARGLIYDRNGTIIVENQPIYSITITPSRFNEENIPTLARILGIDEEILIERISQAQDYSWHRTSRLFTEVPFDVFSAVQENTWQLPGIGHQVESKRYYPTDVKAPHIIGYLREASREEYLASERVQLGDKVGKSGLENVYEDFLRGELGTHYMKVNAYGQSLGTYDNGSLNVSPQKGADLITTIDADLQKLSEELMKGKSGGLVAMDPQTGGILSMVSSPQYDLDKLSGRIDNDYWQEINTDPSRPLFNRAISNRQPPGSTFKPFMGIIGLHLGLVTPETEIYNPGAYYRGRAYRDMADPGDYDLEEAIAKSSNTYFFWMMDRIASGGMLNQWSELIQDFGIGPLNHIDLPSERSGIIPDSTYMNSTFGEDSWGIGDLISLGVGQGMVSASPLQMVVAAASLANGGYRVRPHVVQAIRESDGTIQYVNPEMEKIEWIKNEYLEALKPGMKRVVTEGGGRYYVNIPDIEMAGKTGTAQNPHGENHGWFIAYAPADNPQIAVAALTENAGFGSISAAPVVSLIVEKYLTGEIKRQFVYDYVINFKPENSDSSEEEEEGNE